MGQKTHRILAPTRRDCLRTGSWLAALAAGGGLVGLGPSVAWAAGTEPGTEPDTDPTTATGSTDAAASALARAEVPESAATDVVGPVRDFTLELYREIAAGSPGTNLVCSPYSAYCAMAMARAGAQGRTATEIDAALHAPTELGRSLNALDVLLTSRSGTIQRTGKLDAQITMDVANSLWGQIGTVWQRAFLDALAVDFGAAMNLVDFGTQAETARLTINGWVSDHTNGKILDLLPPGAVDALTRLVLVNAVYFKADWENPFSDTGTQDQTFTRGDGTHLQVPMMDGGTGVRSYTSGDGWQAIDLPYAGRQLAMAVIVPDLGTLPAVERSLDGPGLAAMVAGLRSTQVAVKMPRWTFTSSFDLVDPLRELGISAAFSDGADFGGMSTEASWSITGVVQKAFVAVDEKGTEAAAATGVIVGTTSVMPIEPIRLTIDRPFLFVIHDVPTGTPLFLGRVDDPTTT